LICQLINDDPVRGQKYIDKAVENCETPAQKMKFLFGLKVCFEYSIKDLENHLEDNLYPVTCCSCDVVEDSENRIRCYKSALLKVDSAICFELDCNKIPCDPHTTKQTPNFTPHQWALAFHIFFKAIGVETTNGSQINQVLLARFLHLVTGHDCPKSFNDSTLLDYLKNAPDFKRTTGKQTVVDLEAVRVHFDRVGFSEALATIDTMLVKYRRLSKTHQT